MIIVVELHTLYGRGRARGGSLPLGHHIGQGSSKSRQDYLSEVDYRAARRVQEIAEGTASRRRDIYRHLPVHIGLGDHFTRSSLNLLLYHRSFQRGHASNQLTYCKHSVVL